jgi:hypothetical protein
VTIPTWPLEAAGPAQFDSLVHFCGRPWGTTPTPYVSSGVRNQTPQERLANILWEQRLNGYPPFRAQWNQPMICLSESPVDHLKWLLRDRQWPPWGLLFSRQNIYDLGGGPAWYVREAQYLGLLPEQIPWAVRLETAPPRSDWLHEREWRIPVSPFNPAIFLAPGSIQAVLVGDPDWTPTRQMPVYTGATVTGHVPALPPVWNSASQLRVYWNAATQELTPLLPSQQTTG